MLMLMQLCLFLVKGTIHQSSKDKRSKRKSQNSRNQGFYYFFLLVDGKDPDPISTNYDNSRSVSTTLDDRNGRS